MSTAFQPISQNQWLPASQNSRGGIGSFSYDHPGKIHLFLEVFIGVIIVAYFGWVQRMPASEVALILAFSPVGIAGSFGVAWFGIRNYTLANSRIAFASLEGRAFPVYAFLMKSGIFVGMMLISTELLIKLGILLFVPPELVGKCFIGFAIGESLGAAALRIAAGIFTKIADIGSDLMKVHTMLGLLAVEMAVDLVARGQQNLSWLLAAVFLMLNLVFVYRSFYWRRTEDDKRLPTKPALVTYGTVPQES